MNKKNILFIFCFGFFLLLPKISYAYIGPGIALSAIVTALGILASIVLVFFAIIYYPIKRILKIKKSKKQNKSKKAK